MSPPLPIPVCFFATEEGGIVTSGLVVNFDAGDAASYTGTGTVWTDLVTATNFTLQAIFPIAPGPATQPFYNAEIGYFNFTANNAAGTFVPTIAPTRGAVEIWFRWRDFSAITAAVLLTGGTNWTSLGNVTGTHPDESIEFNSGVAAVMDDQQGHFYYRDNEWHQMVAVIDGVANLLYVDGVAVATTFRSGNATSTGLTSLAGSIIGKYSAGYQFDGDIAIVRVYDTGAGSFSAADVAQNYAADSPRFAAFQPDNISGLKFWIDPSDDNSLELTGATIHEVRDRALAIPTAAAVSAVGSEPVLAAVGGINWMQFAGASSQHQLMRKSTDTADILFSDLFGGSTDSWEVVMVMRPDSSSTNIAATYNNDSAFGDTAGYIGTYVKDPGLGSLTLMTYMWDGVDRAGSISLAPGTKIVLGQSKAAGLQPWSEWNDGAQTVVGTYNNMSASSNPLYFGRGYNPPNYYTGLIGEVCIYDRELTVPERQDLTNYLIAKWGV